MCVCIYMKVKNNFRTFPYPIVKYCYPNKQKGMSLKMHSVSQHLATASHCHRIYNMPKEKAILGTKLHSFTFM